MILVLTACSSARPAHTVADYKAAPLVTTKLVVYQDTYAGNDDWVASDDGQLSFDDGSTVPNNMQLHYDGPAAGHPGSCEFGLDDERNGAEGVYDVPKLVRPCDGKSVATFRLGDVVLSVKGTESKAGIATLFHIDSISGPKLMSYHPGHSPRSTLHSVDNDDF